MRFNFFTDKPLERYRKSDPLIMVSMLLLWGLGILALYFCSRNYGLKLRDDSLYFVKRQLLCSVIGFTAFFVFVSLSMDTIRRILPFIVFGSLFLCVLTFIPYIGEARNGARRWIRIPFIGTFQPSETVKFALVLYLANFFEKISGLKKKDKNVFPAVVFLVAFSGVVILQQDFSTSLFLLILGIAMFVVAGERVRWVIPLGILMVPLSITTVFLKPYRMSRLIGFFDKSGAYDQTYNYQLTAARKAIEDGGFWGQGFGSGLSKIGSIPEVQTDYIFAGWVEAFGFFGVVIYFLLLGFFAWRVLRCALTTADRFASFGVFGFLMSIVGQSLMNVGVVIGVLPTTGVPLPFFSSGGSSIIVTMAMCGFVVGASRLDSVGNVLPSVGPDSSDSGLGGKK